MKKRTHRGWYLGIFLATLCCTGLAPAQSNVRLDLSGIEAWLQCERHAAEPLSPACYSASAGTEGGRLAELPIPTFGEVPKEHSDDAPSSRVAALVAAIRTWNLQQLDAEAAALFPPEKEPVVRVYVVGNGVPVWADMYERSFADLDRHPRLDDNGMPVILINARMVAKVYPGDAAQQAAAARNVLRHELFHVHYACLRLHDERWIRRTATMNNDQRLLLLVQDEGIAHLLASQQEWQEKGFPAIRGERAMEALAKAVAALHGGGDSETILQRANEGPYWDKFGAISGALFAYGVQKEFGPEGLRRTLQEGPPSLLLHYDEATRHDATLPHLLPSLRSWAEQNRAMLPPVSR